MNSAISVGGKFAIPVANLGLDGEVVENNVNKIGGVRSGTLFGDNVSITQRIPIMSTRWSQGLPIQGIDYSITGSAYWQIPENESISDVMTGTDANALIFATTKRLNRYQDGQLCYFLYTLSFENIANANGDFDCLFGGFQRGAGI